MKQGWQEAPRMGLLLLLLMQWTCWDIAISQHDYSNPDTRGDKKFGDKCLYNEECGFDGAICSETIKTCVCTPELPITNHIDKCGIAAKVNESCSFTEQCEAVTLETDCRDGMCACRFEKQPKYNPDGSVECIHVKKEPTDMTYIDPAMIGILVAMCLMFITICVVLRLFSRARWRENRTIFNTPNPRLMNVSLLRDSKHQERRGSRASVREPSRPPSMQSLRPHSPNGRLFLGRKLSRGSSNASTRSNKSLPLSSNAANNSTTVLENVTVEIQEPKS